MNEHPITQEQVFKDLKEAEKNKPKKNKSAGERQYGFTHVWIELLIRMNDVELEGFYPKAKKVMLSAITSLYPKIRAEMWAKVKDNEEIEDVWDRYYQNKQDLIDLLEQYGIINIGKEGYDKGD